MSHETGITSSEDLRTKLAEAKTDDSTARVVKIVIENESLICSRVMPSQGDFNSDFALLRHLTEPNKACYMFVRLDSSNDYGSEWLFVAYVPDNGERRDRMLYASTKAAMKREFGAQQLRSEYNVAEWGDLCIEEYLATQEKGEAPLTEAEKELNEVKHQEALAGKALGAKAKLSANLGFPPTSKAQSAIDDFVSGSANFCQFVIDGKAETVDLITSCVVGLDGVDGYVPRDRATYNLIKYPAMEPAEAFLAPEPVLFAHCIASGSGVKEKMLFSSCKATFLQCLESMGVAIDRKVEVDLDDEALSHDRLLQEVKVVVHEEKKKFDKPARPGKKR